MVSLLVLRLTHSEALLVQTRDRQDTWEMPGGQVEEGESPHLRTRLTDVLSGRSIPFESFRSGDYQPEWLS